MAQSDENKSEGGEAAGDGAPKARVRGNGLPPIASKKMRKLRLCVKNGTFLDRKSGVRWSDPDGAVKEVDAERAKELLALKHHTYNENGIATTVPRFEVVDEE